MTDLSTQAQAIVDAYENTTDKYKALAAVLRALVEKLGYEYVYHIDDGEGGILYDCKNHIIDVCEVVATINELEEL